VTLAGDIIRSKALDVLVEHADISEETGEDETAERDSAEGETGEEGTPEGEDTE
jgi:hypothetical protein